MATIELDQNHLTAEARQLITELTAAFATQLQAAARAVAMARGQKIGDAEDVRRAQAHLLSGPAQTLQRIFEMCNRTIKAGGLDGDCPAYDIRHICLGQLQEWQSMTVNLPAG